MGKNQKQKRFSGNDAFNRYMDNVIGRETRQRTKLRLAAKVSNKMAKKLLL